MNFHWEKNGFLISTDPTRLDLEVIHGFLEHSYWAKGIPMELVIRSIEGSVCFGLYERQKQIGFARVITDRATFGYLADVFVLPSHQHMGLGKWLIACVMECPSFNTFRRWMLSTRDAHSFYRRFGFTSFSNPEGSLMQIHRPRAHLNQDESCEKSRPSVAP